MDDFSWMHDYIAEEADRSDDKHSTSLNQPPQPKKKKGNKRSSNKPWFTKFPPLARVKAMRVQFFDNGPNPGKGKNQHILKLRVYLDDGKPLNQRDPHWYRIVQLIEPKRVVTWAEDEHAAGRLSDEMVAHYRAVADELGRWKTSDPEADWVKMGHIGSPPGNIYFHGQFAAVRSSTAGEMEMVLHLDGDDPVEIERFHPNKRSKNSKAPKSYGLYDPTGVIDKRERDDDV